MKRYRKRALLNFFTKTQASNECDGGNETEEVGNVADKNNLIAMSLNTISVAQSEDLGASIVTNVGHHSSE